MFPSAFFLSFRWVEGGGTFEIKLSLPDDTGFINTLICLLKKKKLN